VTDDRGDSDRASATPQQCDTSDSTPCVPDTTVTRQAAVWRRPDGTFAAKVLPIGDSRGGPGMLRAGTPGTLAVVEHFVYPRRAHFSTDYGVTWQIRQVPEGVDSGGSLPADWPSWLPG